VTSLHRLVAAQLAKATRSGEVDHGLLCELMSTCYEEMERDRKRVDRASTLMEEELTQLTGDLEWLVEETRMQNLHFQAALDNMSQGLCLLDAEGRLTVANRRFLQIYGLSADAGTPGRPMAEILGESAVLPCPRDYLALTSARETVTLQQELNDGRTILIAHQPLERGGCVDTFEDITARERANERLVLATEGGNIGLWDAHVLGGSTWFSDQFAGMLGYSLDELPSTLEAVVDHLVHPDDRTRLFATFTEYLSGANGNFEIEFRMRCKDGSWRWIHSKGRTVDRAPDGRTLRLAGVHIDVTERKEVERRLAAAERLESIGRLAAGVAHEINTPVQFVSDNVQFMRTSMAEIHAVIQTYRGLQRAAQSGGDVLAAARLAADAERAADLDYLMEDVPRAIDSSIDGLDRIATIVRSMREFAHPDQEQKGFADLNRAIQSTLVIARNEYKYVAEIDAILGELPPVSCHLGEINQVILNLLVNASHAIADVVKGSETLGKITVRTRLDGDEVEISIADTGTGIPETERDKIFEPFFTTKEVGKGTGQGLSHAHSVIVKKHAGTLRFETDCGKGTTFFIRLPIDSTAGADAEQVAA